MADKLTPQQEMAVYNRGGKLLVSAAAGSGKTKVLVDRLMVYLTDPVHPANIDDFLIITFTEAAAAELRCKIATKLNERIAEDPTNKHLQRQIQRLYLAQISTIHAFCSTLLRDHAFRLDISSDFRMADDKESGELRMRVVEKVMDDAYQSDDPYFYAFIDSQSLGRTDNTATKIVLDVYKKSMCHLNPNAWLAYCVDATDTSKMADASETIWGQYLIKDYHDMVDLLIEAMQNGVQLAEESPDLTSVAAHLRENVALLHDFRGRSTWSEIVAAKDLKFGTLRFPKGYEAEDRELITTVRDRCKKLLSKKLEQFSDTNQHILEDIVRTRDSVKGLVSLVQAFAREYALAKRQRKIVDFTDLEHMTLDLLVGKNRDSYSAIADEIGSRYREVMVDEYQDTNEVQDYIFSALTRKRNNCFMVGDVKQSIYQFRLADPSIFIEKYNTYQSAERAMDGEGRKVLLSSNFRSSAGVIDAVNDVFTQYMSPQIGGLYYSSDEKLNEGIPHKQLHEPEVEFYAIDVAHDRYDEESAFVAQRIKTLLDGSHMVRDGEGFRPIIPDDIVILLRSPGSVGADYLRALEKVGIRCVCEKSGDLLRTEEVTVFRSILQCVSNPLQDIPVAAAVTSRVIGINTDELSLIRAEKREGSLYESLKASSRPSAVRFCSMLATLRNKARMSRLTELLDSVLMETSMDSIYGALPDGNARINNIYHFCQLAGNFEANRQGDLDRFLAYLDNLEEDKGYPLADESGEGAVRIMSVHKSKGLEFPVVFVAALAKGFNDEDTKNEIVSDSDLCLGLYSADNLRRIKYPNIARRTIINKIKASSLSEEMRILYVALTRARDRLIMTYSCQDVASRIDALSHRMELFPKALMAADISSVGDWVLMTAMQRAEANKLFVDARRPSRVREYKEKWYIDLIEHVALSDVPSTSFTAETLELSQNTISKIDAAVTYEYPYRSATVTPSKLTATQLKGRYKDLEVAQGTERPPTKYFRKPAFIQKTCDGRTYGNAMHAAMQHIQFNACNSLDGITSEIQRLINENIISSEYGNLIDTHALKSFFDSDLGGMVRCGKNVLREFKFSVLDKGEIYAPGMSEEEVLIQGVVDCVLVENDGLTIIDFKTDNVCEEKLESVVKSYKQQIEIYAHALSRIYKLPVKRTVLYFFKLQQFVDV